MFCSCDFAITDLIARQCAPSRDYVSRTAAALFSVAIAVCALAGCRTANYTTRSLPVELQAPPMPTTTNINLERMGSDGVGTSQIGPGDLVSITIVSGNADERVMPIPARVAQDGTITVPLVGSVKIGDMEPVAAEQQIIAAAVDRGIYKQPSVTLTVTQRTTNHVTVLGAVSKPGVVELPRGSCDLASALAAAGGLAVNAGTQVEVLRQGASILAAKEKAKRADDDSSGVKLASLTEPIKPAAAASAGSSEMSRIDLAQAGSGAIENRQLEDRDVVNVLPQEKRLIHVTGLVRKPDQFELVRDKDIRVLDAIAMAGGTTSSMANKVYVIRQLPNMTEPAVIQISISKAKSDGDENLRLAAGDLVSVEDTMTTMMTDTAGKFFRIALGLNGSVAAF